MLGAKTAVALRGTKEKFSVGTSRALDRAIEAGTESPERCSGDSIEVFASRNLSD